MTSEEILILLNQEAWRNAPEETDPLYFRTWHRVSIALQRSLRRWTSEINFRDATRFEDRAEAFPVVVYAGARVFYGRAKTEFTYDVADPRTLVIALRAIGRPIQNILGPMAERLKEIGRPELARRYAPVWHHDVLAAVKKKPRRLVALLAREAKIIDAVIDLGTAHDAAAAYRCAKISNATLRNMLLPGVGDDMRELLPAILDEASKVLAANGAHGVDHLRDGRIFENGDAIAARRPDAGIGDQENRDHGDSEGGGEMGDAGVVAKVHAGGREPTGQLV